MAKPLLTEAEVKRLYEVDIRQERLDDIYRLLNGWAGKHSQDLASIGVDPEDFVQDVVHNIFKRQGLDKYDDTKTVAFEAFIFRLAKNYFIDLYRKKNAKSRLDPQTGKPVVVTSMNRRVGDDDGTELGDLLPQDDSGEESEVDPTDYLASEPDGTLYVSSFKVTPDQKAKSVVLLQKRLKQLGVRNFADFKRKRDELPSADRKLLDALISKTHESAMKSFQHLRNMVHEVEAAQSSDPVPVRFTNKNGGTAFVKFVPGPLASAPANAKKLFGDNYTYEVAKDFMPKGVTESLTEEEVSASPASQFPVKVSRKNNGQFEIHLFPGTSAADALKRCKDMFGADFDCSAAPDFQLKV